MHCFEVFNIVLPHGPEVSGDVLSSAIMGHIVSDKAVKYGEPGVNHSRSIPNRQCRHFDRFSSTSNPFAAIWKGTRPPSGLRIRRMWMSGICLVDSLSMGSQLHILTLMVYLLPILSYLSASKSVCARPPDPVTMTITAPEAVASSSGKNRKCCFSYKFTNIAPYPTVSTHRPIW